MTCNGNSCDYWESLMNSYIPEIVSGCAECRLQNINMNLLVALEVYP